VNQYGGHHRACSAPWGECECAGLWLADEIADNDDELDHAYGQFYDPDYDSDPYAERESYGGWSRAHQGAP
jgi:hypothetical protein